MVSGLQSKDYVGKLHELGLESLQDRRTRLDLLQTFKIIKGIDNVEKEFWFRTYGESVARETRQSSYPDNIVPSNVPRTDLRRNFFSQRVVKLWNELPGYVKESRNISIFKLNYNKFKGASSGANTPDN